MPCRASPLPAVQKPPKSPSQFNSHPELTIPSFLSAPLLSLRPLPPLVPRQRQTKLKTIDALRPPSPSPSPSAPASQPSGQRQTLTLDGRRHLDGRGALRLLPAEPAVVRGGAAAAATTAGAGPGLCRPRAGAEGGGGEGRRRRGGGADGRPAEGQRGGAAAADEAGHGGGRDARAPGGGQAHAALLPRQRRRPRPDVRALRRAQRPPQRQPHGVRVPFRSVPLPRALSRPD